MMRVELRVFASLGHSRFKSLCGMPAPHFKIQNSPFDM